MVEYKIYSLDIWDYLVDMSYMPSRKDRDELIEANEDIRVKIWDYFFRIKPTDVGKPQKKEIDEINNRLQEKINKYNQLKKELKEKIVLKKADLFYKKLRIFLYWIGGGIVTGGICNFVLFYQISFINYIFLALLIILGTIFSIYFLGRGDVIEIALLIKRLADLQEEHNQTVKIEIKRRKFLESEIRALIIQIPDSPRDEEVRGWLDNDLLFLLDKSKDETGLGTKLVDLSDEAGVYDIYGNLLVVNNPVPVIGPVELQPKIRIPKNFSEKIDLDLYKHLKARRSRYYMVNQNQRIEVFYGVYYIEHILIGDDMLATYGLFFDFITGKMHAEQITEQYYKDVVSISVVNEFRTIPLAADIQKQIYIEDAPTFTMSLSSGEKRIVTFVNEKYFMKIKEKIGVSENNIINIGWIEQSKLLADSAIKALRHYVRLHKKTNGIEL